jgi:hypothetical protein
MPGPIEAAAIRLNDRKLAAGADSATPVEINTASPVYSGLDLDPYELEQGAKMAEVVAQKLLDVGESPVSAAASLWLDGIAMGLLLAEARG